MESSAERVEKFSLDEIEDPKPTRRECRPCEQKGSYLGTTDCGWRLLGDRRNSQVCELLDRNLCDKRFELEFSDGTLWHRLKKPTSGFLGCKSLDQNLLEEKLLSLEPNTAEVISHDPVAISPLREIDDPMLIPETDALIKNKTSALHFHGALDKKKSEYDAFITEQRRTPSPDTPLSSLFGPRPESLEHLHFKHLLEKGYFEKINAQDDLERDRVIFIAQLLIRGFWDLEVIERAFPEVKLPNFEILKRKILWHVRKTMPQKAKRFEEFWDTLTDNQAEALWLYYMRNPYKRSKEFVASRIGISVDSLKDRLEGAIKKLKKAFPELVEINQNDSDDENDNQKAPKIKALPLKIYSKEEILASTYLQKNYPPRHRFEPSKFKTYEEYEQWEKNNAWYPNVNGVW